MTITVIGLFSQTKQASESINGLETQGIKAQKISMITSDNIDKNAFEITENTKLPEAAGIGAASGGALGLIVGGLTALGNVATGGIGLLASGPIIASLTGGAFGAYGGGIIGAVLGTTLPDSEQQAILDELEKGGVLVCVECQSSEKTSIMELLQSQKAKRVDIADFAELEQMKGH